VIDCSSPIAPKSSERRHTNGWMASRKYRPRAASPATARARMKAGPLPRQRARFIIGDGRFDGERDRGDFRRGPQAQIDPEDIAFSIALLDELDDALPDPHRRLPRLLPRPQRQRLRIEQED
jgi:hypothetical protein